MYPLGMEIAALSPLVWVVSNRREGHPGSLGKVDFTPFSIRITSGYKMQEEGWGEIGGFAEHVEQILGLLWSIERKHGKGENLTSISFLFGDGGMLRNFLLPHGRREKRGKSIFLSCSKQVTKHRVDLFSDLSQWQDTAEVHSENPHIAVGNI